MPQNQLEPPTCWKSLLLWIGMSLRTMSWKARVKVDQDCTRQAEGCEYRVAWAVGPPYYPRSLDPAQHRDGGRGPMEPDTY